MFTILIVATSTITSKASPIASPVASYSEQFSTIAPPPAPYSEDVSTIASPLAPYSGRGVGGEGQTEAANTPAYDLTTGELSDYVDLVPYSPLRPIFRDLAFAGAELEISGEVLQAIFVEMDLPELAITGPAIVHDIRNAPTVKPGAGRVITATFHHSSGDVIDLVVGESEPTALAAGGPEDGGRERHDPSQLNLSSTSSTNVSTSTNNIGTRVSFERPVLRSPAASAVGSQGSDQISDSDTIGTTSNHPFWSVDRQEYVQAGQLAIGERLQTFSGDTKRVVSKLARPGPEPVYNLEVFAEHVYYVGKDGVLVHNSYVDSKLDNYADTAFDAVFRSKNKVYEQHEVFDAIEAAHGFRPTRSQYDKIMDRLRSVFTTGHDPIVIGTNGGYRTIDFRGWAVGGKTHLATDLKPGFVLDTGASGMNRIKSLRQSHIGQLNGAVDGSSADTWHHMDIRLMFQQVNPNLHQLFKGHAGLELWGL